MRKYRCATPDEMKRAQEMRAVRLKKVETSEEKDEAILREITRLIRDEPSPSAALASICDLLTRNS